MPKKKKETGSPIVFLSIIQLPKGLLCLYQIHGLPSRGGTTQYCSAMYGYTGAHVQEAENERQLTFLEVGLENKNLSTIKINKSADTNTSQQFCCVFLK